MDTATQMNQYNNYLNLECHLNCSILFESTPVLRGPVSNFCNQLVLSPWLKAIHTWRLDVWLWCYVIRFVALWLFVAVHPLKHVSSHLYSYWFGIPRRRRPIKRFCVIETKTDSPFPNLACFHVFSRNHAWKSIHYLQVQGMSSSLDGKPIKFFCHVWIHYWFLNDKIGC